MESQESVPLLATRDESLVEAVQATALALSVPLVVVSDREDLRQRWASATVRLVGADMAARAEALTASGTVYVVGHAGTALLEASALLRAPALALPQASAQLADVLTNLSDHEAHARVFAVVGASGGLGASSLAVGLATHAADTGGRTALVETALCGGGLDLLFGAESAPGLRWDQLLDAAGQLGDLGGHLVRADGVDVLALSRQDNRHPGSQAAGAVLRSLGRSHDTVVVDAGVAPAGRWPEVLLLVAADVRGVAAARMSVELHQLRGARLVVRTGAGRQLPPQAVADALGMELAGQLRHDPEVPRLAGSGTNVAGGPARRLRRDVAQIWGSL